MEEDMKILQNFINEDWNCKYTLTKVKQSMKNILEELEKKDKIIEEMANSFADGGFYLEHCQTLTDNDICLDDCEKCIKQYFQKKAEER